MFLSYLSSFALNLINHAGYAGIFLLSMLESMAIPIPSEIVVPFAGFLSLTGRFNLWIVVLVATVANLVGAIILFLVARSGGRWVLEKYGRYVFINKEDLDRADRWYKKHGSKATFFSRLLPVIRTFIPLPAGVARMDFPQFILYTFLGSLPWNFGLALIGYKTGENWSRIHPYFQKLDVIIIVIVIFLISLHFFRKRK